LTVAFLRRIETLAALRQGFLVFNGVNTSMVAPDETPLSLCSLQDIADHLKTRDVSFLLVARENRAIDTGNALAYSGHIPAVLLLLDCAARYLSQVHQAELEEGD
jgi:hypothetical protein